ncbi:hypothetical protein TrCOL_g12347 [Triparma columacea]|uniref:tRNA (adenine(58)-N(1))-methyltransferase n=1 Tax=Triparma columacea TaxID=722753 RepID=A0A9W7LE87_9STRA|nr:hypothetical protein TrCOL_g12347 [Triparma columacea]
MLSRPQSPELDHMNGLASNAALDDQISPTFTSCSSFTESLIPRSSTISAGDLVVIYSSVSELDFVYASPGSKHSNRNGTFHHDDFLGQEFGVKVPSRSTDGFVFALRPTPELWSSSLPHRTQIVHDLDQCNVILYLDLKPGSVVLESGTGSGAMSTAIARTVSPGGKVWTYEFNEDRVTKARDEFARNGLADIITVTHRDVCGKREGDVGGFGDFVPDSSADAIFLDLPEPWEAVGGAADKIKPNGKICSYSPCIEQSQKFCAAAEAAGFHSVNTMEVRLKEYCVDCVLVEDEIVCDLPFYYGNKAVSDRKTGEKRKAEEGAASEASRGGGLGGGRGGKTELRTRPKQTMRGHTAFLSFATFKVGR